MRALLHNETVTFDGEYVHLDGVELDYVYQERRPKDVPIYIGATGMQMMELTGEIADGVVLNYLVSPDYNAPGHGAPRRRRGRGRPHASTTSTARSSSCARVHEDRADRARHGPPDGHAVPRPAAPHHEGVAACPQSLLDDVGEVLTWPATHEQVEAASKLVPDEIVQMLTASGTADECPGEGRRVRRAPAARARSCTRSATSHAMIDAFSDWPA